MNIQFSINKLMRLMVAFCLILSSLATIAEDNIKPADPYRQKKSDKIWEERIRPATFQDRKIIEAVGQDVLEIKAPYRAEDASVVPVSINTKIPQTAGRYIKKITLFIDMNPVPLVGVFEFTLASGRADLAMRVRVDDFTYIRAIAEMNNGNLFMTKSFVRARGACSAAPPPSAAESLANLGKIKMNTVGDIVFGEPNLMQIKISHPNVTGLAYDPVYNSRPPAYFLKEFRINYEGTTIIKAQLTFAISQDPSFRFFFVPEKEGLMTVDAIDTKDNKFTSTHKVSLAS